MLSNKLISLFIVLHIAFKVVSQYCTAPQKALFISFNSMSKRDTLPNLFKDVNTKLPKYNKTATKQQIDYGIINLLPQLYYSEHNQIQKYINNDSLNVQLGRLHLAYQFLYSIVGKNIVKVGNASGHVNVLGKSFVKKLVNSDKKMLIWELVSVFDLQVNTSYEISSSQPKLTIEERKQFQQMLNEEEMKKKLIEVCNQNYKILLKQHLSNEQIANNISIQYKYNNNTFTYLNLIKNYTLNNDLKGLEIYFYFQLESKTSNCTSDSIQIKYKNYRGFQEIYSISSFREALIDAVKSGFFDTTLDRKWDVPLFQFYMGDLTEIPEAGNYPANQPITVHCSWDRTTPPQFKSFYDHFLYAQLSMYCKVRSNEKQLFELEIQNSLVIKISPLDDSLVFEVYQTKLYLIDYQPLDPKFVVSNKELLKFHCERVLDGLVGSKVIGTGWKTQKRRFPCIDILNEDYIIVFDPSQV